MDMTSQISLDSPNNKSPPKPPKPPKPSRQSLSLPGERYNLQMKYFVIIINGPTEITNGVYEPTLEKVGDYAVYRSTKSFDVKMFYDLIEDCWVISRKLSSTEEIQYCRIVRRRGMLFPVVPGLFSVGTWQGKGGSWEAFPNASISFVTISQMTKQCPFYLFVEGVIGSHAFKINGEYLAVKSLGDEFATAFKSASFEEESTILRYSHETNQWQFLLPYNDNESVVVAKLNSSSSNILLPNVIMSCQKSLWLLQEDSNAGDEFIPQLHMKLHLVPAAVSALMLNKKAEVVDCKIACEASAKEMKDLNQLQLRPTKGVVNVKADYSVSFLSADCQVVIDAPLSARCCSEVELVFEVDAVNVCGNVRFELVPADNVLTANDAVLTCVLSNATAEEGVVVVSIADKVRFGVSFHESSLITLCIWKNGIEIGKKELDIIETSDLTFRFSGDSGTSVKFNFDPAVVRGGYCVPLQTLYRTHPNVKIFGARGAFKEMINGTYHSKFVKGVAENEVSLIYVHQNYSNLMMSFA